MPPSGAPPIAAACEQLAVEFARTRRFVALRRWAQVAPLGMGLTVASTRLGADGLVRPLFALVTMSLGLALVGAALWPLWARLRLRVALRPRALLVGAAQWFDRADPDATRAVAIDAVDAQALLAAPPSDPVARALAQSHAAHAARQLGGALLTYRRQRTRKRARPLHAYGAVRVFAAQLVALVAICAVFAAGDLQRVRQLLRDELVVDFADAPLSSDWQPDIEPPAYQRRPREAPSRTSSDVAAYTGSRLVLSGVLDAEAPWAELWVFADERAFLAHRPLLRVPATLDGRALVASLPVTADCVWGLVVGRDARHAQQERLVRRLHVKRDGAPRVVIESPGAEEAWPAKGELPLRWRAEDDFGLERIEVCARTQADAPEPVDVCLPAPIVLEKTPPSATASEASFASHASTSSVVARGNVLLPLGPFREALRHADGELDITLCVEATDNDTWQGPHRGRSAPLVVTLYDPRAIRAWSLEAARRAQQALVVWLADEWAPADAAVLDGSPAHAALLTTSVESAVRALTRAYSLLEEDEESLPVERHAVDEGIALCEAVQRQAPAWFDASPREARLKRLGATILSLDRLFSTRRLGEAKAQKEDATDAIARLEDALASHAGDTEALKAALVSVKDRLAQFAQALSHQRESLSQTPGVEHTEQRGTFEEALQRIEDAMARGDTEQAARELETLKKRLESMQDAADEAKEQQEDPLDAEVQRGLEALAKSAERALHDERALLASLSSAMAPTKPSATPGLKRAETQFAQAMAAAQKSVDALGKLERIAPFVEQERHALESDLTSLRTLFASRLYPESLTRAQRAAAVSRELKDRWSDATLDAMLGGEKTAASAAKSLIRELPETFEAVQRALETLVEEQKRGRSQQERHAFEQLSAPQQKAADDIEKMSAALKKLHDKEPILPEHHPRLDAAAEAAKRSASSLGERDGDSAQQSLSDAVASLESFLEDLESQKKDSAEAGGQAAPMPGAMPQRQPGGKRPTPGEGEPREEPGGQKKGPKRQQKKRGDKGEKDVEGRDKNGKKKQPNAKETDGRTPSDGDKVDIPGFDARRDPSAYRKRVQEAAQEPPPAAYKKAVRDYYEELLR